MHGPQGMNPNESGDPVTLHLMKPAGQKSNSGTTNQLPLKRLTFPQMPRATTS